MENQPELALMRTALFLLTGLLLLAAAAFNMWTGVAKAGYSASEELPVFALIFLAPAVVAVLVKWRFL
jgi:hypothetical protein